MEGPAWLCLGGFARELASATAGVAAPEVAATWGHGAVLKFFNSDMCVY